MREIPNKIYIYLNNEGDNHYHIGPADNPVDKKHEQEYVSMTLLSRGLKGIIGKEERDRIMGLIQKAMEG